MLLDELLKRNRDFVRGRESRPLSDLGVIRIAFVACFDPRLDAIMRPALGLAPGEGIVLRTAGARIGPEGDPVRSLVLAVFLFDVTEIYVIAHSSCRMKTFGAAPFIDAFRARGVSRESFGGQDLRDWAGAFADTGAAVAESIRVLAAVPMMPADLVLGGLLLDDSSGALEVLAAPATVATLRATAGIAAAPVLAEVKSAPVAPQPAIEIPTGPSREVQAMRGFVQSLESASGWRDDLAKLRLELDRQKNPVARLTLIEKFVRRAAVNARGVAAAFDQMKKESTEELIDLFRRAGRTG